MSQWWMWGIGVLALSLAQVLAGIAVGRWLNRRQKPSAASPLDAT